METPFKAVGKLVDIVNGMAKSRALYTVAQLNVANCIEPNGRMSSDQIAKQVHCDPSILYRLMRALSQVGVFRECEDDESGASHMFEHTEESIAMRNENFGNFVLATGLPTVFKTWELFPEVVTKSDLSTGSGNTISNKFFEELEQRQEEALVFGKGMTAITYKIAPLLVAQSDYSQFDTVVDVGGSEGILLSEILKVNKNIKLGINFDLPRLIEKFQTSMPERTAQLNARFKDVSGSFFESVPTGDCFILKSILHDWSDQCAKDILCTVVRSMKPSSKIYLYEFLVNNEKNEKQSPVVWMDIRMLNYNDGKERTLKEYQSLATECGLEVERVVSMEMLPSLIILVKATATTS
ncbi:hypothetical protein SAMD00019534_125340 [Acytostelium subglobosum LB1]|uniref:hypothetical protein n=1 Tax=Acytostelium subglobosum LB1 TaxID=1410327 RepID=UPI000645235C|nr:hypothetical protein SAMD00019534_125340 [Acytostelium subglobosum LB1]GAM29358.1 hypothetical protein SAMD00019534_125340 [Acytostelium subglobosum LB1]|eukprot:XP_012747689.1 hypothetical protein SAMD00019534_125340 [Acytostelium subglobosum LB1]